MSDSYPCACRGHRVLDVMPGSYEICPVCFWEDDGVQFRWPTMDGGANKVSLIEAQRNYQDFGARDEHGRRYVRPPAEDQPLDPAWRPIDLTRDSFEDWEAEGRTPWPDDRSVLCWWLPTFLAPGPPVTTHIERLIQQLDDSTGPSYDARAELIGIDSDAIPALIDGLPSLGGFGQLTAIEVFEEVADPRCGPALITLLGRATTPPSGNGRRWPWRAWRSTARSSPCAAPIAPIAPAWNGRRHRTGASRKASAGP